MKDKIKEKPIDLQNPQEALEKVLMAEIDIANRVSDAREQADKELLEAQNNLAAFKNKMVEDARSERDRIFQEGVKSAKEEAEKKIVKAHAEAQLFLLEGRKFIPKAGEYVLALLLGLGKDLR